MVNKETYDNLTAKGFFGENSVASPTNSSTNNFRDTLREQVLQKYINYDQDTLMEESNLVQSATVPFWKRNNFLKFAGGFAAVILVTIAAFTFVLKSSATLKGEMAYTEGNVLYKTAASDWTKADKDLVLQQGYSIKVEGNGKAIANLDDGSAIRLNDNSAVTLTSMDASHVVITNDQGEVYSRVAKAQRTFDVIANGITYRSLGTAYKTLCLDATDNTVITSGVEVYESKVQILGVTDNNEIIVQQGEKYYVVNTDDPEQMQKIEVLSKDDLQSDEFTMWNKTQDELVAQFKSQMGVLFDIKIPELTVISPATQDSVTSNATVNVSGITEDGIKLTVNDVEIPNNAGAFDYVYNLVDGYNGIKLIAEDASGNKAVRNFRVKFENPNAEVTPTANPEQTAAPTSVPNATAKPSGISLSGTKVSNGVSFTWNVTGLDVSKGFKIVKSTGNNPVYPGNDYVYLTDANQRNYTWQIKDGVTYKFRICQYNGNGACLVYSNQITVQAPTAPTATPSNPVTSISLSANQSTKKVSWSAVGVSASGFKVVWSKTSGPTYSTRPTDQYQYHGSSSAVISDVLTAFDGYGTYYVRVCAYQNGSNGECTPYSNQVTLTLGTPSPTPTVAPTDTPVPTGM